MNKDERIKKLKEDFIRTQVAEKQVDKIINRVYGVLDVRGIRYNKKTVRNRLIKIGIYYNIEEDISEIINFLINENRLVPENIDHFWGYVVRTLQYPPFEPKKHLKARNGKKRIWGREWAYLMKIKRYPNKINEKQEPQWLSYSLTYNRDFANVYNKMTAQAREMIGELDETELKDKNYGNLGMKKSLIDIDLNDILHKIEES